MLLCVWTVFRRISDGWIHGGWGSCTTTSVRRFDEEAHSDLVLLHIQLVHTANRTNAHCAGRTGKNTGKKDEPASDNHNLNRTLRKKFCKGSGATWHTYLINIHSTETTEQQHIIHKQEDCPNPRRIGSQRLVTTCSHFPSSLREGVLKKHMSGGSNAVKAL
jgi:hypothetical protein